MLPKFHIFYGFIFALLVVVIYPVIGYSGFFAIWISSFLIDFDHYLFYAFKKKDFNPFNSFKWFMEKHRRFMKLSRVERAKVGGIPCIFHGLELFIILLVLSFYQIFFIYILIGIVFHQFLDFIHAIYYGGTLTHFGSQIFNIISYSNKSKFYSK